MHWTYQNVSDGVKTPFEVPSDLITISRTDIEQTANLIDYIQFSQDVTGPLSISVKSYITKTIVFDLVGMLLGENINII